MTYQELVLLEKEFLKEKINNDRYTILKKHDIQIPELYTNAFYIPYKYGRRFPKNIPKYLMDNYEGYYPISKILNSISLFNKTHYSLMIPHSYVTHASAGGGCTEGSALTCGTPPDGTTINAADLLFCGRTESEGTAGQCYDQLGIRANTTNGSILMKGGFYDHDGLPNNLQGEGAGGVTPVADTYVYDSFTEVSLNTDRVWNCFIHDTNLDMHRRTSRPRSFQSSYGYSTAFEDPWTGGSSTGTTYQMELSHS